MRRPVYDMLQTVAARMSLHMPAAQGKAPFQSQDPYLLETTELAVTDDLYRPDGAIKQAQQLLAESAKAKASYFLQGGSTAGIHAMILYACKRGERIILPRNVHLSVLNICAIAGVEPVFAEITEISQGYLLTTPDAYADAVQKYPDAKAVLVISSDYYGILCDVKAIAQIAHQYGALLLCDEAHGAYFNWRTDIQNAGQKGADLFVQSAHKTLPALNAAAWLHAMQAVDTDKLAHVLRMVQTSSPSFVLMQGMDDARAWMDVYGQEACICLQKAVKEFSVRASLLGFTDDRVGLAHDDLRLVLKSSLGGEYLQQQLQLAGIDIEMSDTWHIVGILSLMDGEKRLNSLLDSLTLIVKADPDHTLKPQSFKQKPDRWPQRIMPLSEAMFADTVTLDFAEATGSISAATVGMYPPGIAWISAGEVITEEITEMICTTPANRIFGITNGIRCVK